MKLPSPSGTGSWSDRDSLASEGGEEKKEGRRVWFKRISEAVTAELHSHCPRPVCTCHSLTHISQSRQDKSCSLNLRAYWIYAFWSSDHHPGKAKGLRALSASGKEPSIYKTEQVSLKSITRVWDDKRQDLSLDPRTHAKVRTFVLTYIHPRDVLGRQRREALGLWTALLLCAAADKTVSDQWGRRGSALGVVPWPLYVLLSYEHCGPHTPACMYTAVFKIITSPQCHVSLCQHWFHSASLPSSCRICPCLKILAKNGGKMVF